MNNNPGNVAVILRSLIVYAVCASLAIFLGYMLANPMTVSTFASVGVLLLVLGIPLLLRWHQPLLLLSWNMSAVLFFLKGQPNLWLVMVVVSLTISVLERTLNNRMHFIRAPQITWPLLCLIGVVLFTAKLTGGIGLHAFGSEVYGGKKYVFLLIGILSYFALTAQKIPPRRAKLYTALFFLGGVTGIIGDLWPVAPSALHLLFWFFPPSIYYQGTFDVGTTRLGGASGAGSAIVACMMAIYGIRGIFLSGKLWRPFVFALAFVMIFLGGFRSTLAENIAFFILLFFLEGLHRSRLMPVFVLSGLLAVVLVIPLARHLPFTFQRTLSFLPLDLDPAAKQSAKDSLDWRLQMWTALWPQVPKHLLLGKGYGISPEDYNEMMGNTALAFNVVDPSQQGLALSDDYHNGMLSVLLPFGIWGLIAYLWFLGAGLYVLYCNFRYGDPALRTINAFFFVSFLVEVVSFLSCFAGLPLNVAVGILGGRLGLSVALNGGVRRPAPATVQAKKPFNPANALTYPRRPAFQK